MGDDAKTLNSTKENTASQSSTNDIIDESATLNNNHPEESFEAKCNETKEETVADSDVVKEIPKTKLISIPTSRLSSKRGKAAASRGRGTPKGRSKKGMKN